MKKTFTKYSFITVLLMSIAAPVCSQTLISGDIVQFIRTIKESMPDKGTNKYFIPTNAHLNFFDTLFIDLKKKDFSTIQTRAAQYGYQFLQFVDSQSKDTFLILKENIPVLRGWGTFIFNPSGKNDVTVESPHPIWDTNSWELAIRLFIKMNAKWFSLAGTHRYCNSDSLSDMAHVTQSVFQVFHKRTATATAIQIHGFSKTGENTGYPDAVISNGTLNPPSILFTIKTKYESKGFTAGVFSSATYSQLKNLGATTNKQGQWSNSNGKSFVHIEHDYPLRNTQSKQQMVIDAICETYVLPTTIEKEKSLGKNGFELLNNFPNPFNPSTMIQYSLPKEDFVKITVYNALGAEIAVLLSDRQEGGLHALQFNAERLISGIYFCTIKTTSHSKTIKMVLVK